MRKFVTHLITLLEAGELMAESGGWTHNDIPNYATRQLGKYWIIREAGKANYGIRFGYVTPDLFTAKLCMYAGNSHELTWRETKALRSACKNKPTGQGNLEAQLEKMITAYQERVMVEGQKLT